MSAQQPMLDSDIIIDAIEGIRGETTDTARAGLELLKSCTRFYVSSITVFELTHTDNQHQRQIFGKLAFQELSVVRNISNLAAEIANHARREGMLCKKCWAMLPTRPCEKCNGQVARQQRINDILIAATAEIHEIPQLYARDGGMLELGKLKQFFRHTQIEKPPEPPKQLPLLPDNTVRLEQKQKHRKH